MTGKLSQYASKEDKIQITSDLDGDDDLLASRLEERFLVTVHLVDLDRERERDLDLERDEENLSLTVSEGFTLGPPARLRSFA